jgi:hypothetical protein
MRESHTIQSLREEFKKTLKHYGWQDKFIEPDDNEYYSGVVGDLWRGYLYCALSNGIINKSQVKHEFFENAKIHGPELHAKALRR